MNPHVHISQLRRLSTHGQSYFICSPLCCLHLPSDYFEANPRGCINLSLNSSMYNFKRGFLKKEKLTTNPFSHLKKLNSLIAPKI